MGWLMGDSLLPSSLNILPFMLIRFSEKEMGKGSHLAFYNRFSLLVKTN